MIFKNIIYFTTVFFFSSICIAQDDLALSTSNWIQIDHQDLNGNRIGRCSGDAAISTRSYVGIEATKFRVAKNDGWIKKLFNNNRRAFPVVSIEGSYLQSSLNITKVGGAKTLRKEMSNVDLGTTWNILNTSPWTLKDVSINVKIGYSADSSLDFVLKSFNEITSNIPNFTLNTAASIGTSIASTVDNLLFGSERITSLLSSEKDIPTLGNNSLCEGYIVIYAATDAVKYNKYEHGDVVWDESSQDLLFDGIDNHDISYVVLKINVEPRLYAETKDALNDTGKVWSQRYRAAQSSMQDLILSWDAIELENKSKEIQTKLIEAKTFLHADLSLIQEERLEIHRYVASDIKLKLDALKTRFATTKNGVTVDSTSKSLKAFVEASRASEIGIDTNLSETLLSQPDSLRMLSLQAPTLKDKIAVGEALSQSVRNIDVSL